MSLIYLASSETGIDLPSDESVLHVHRVPPSGLFAGDARRMAFRDFAEKPRESLQGVETLVVHGMSRLIGPGNRTDFVFEILHNLTPDLRKISIDETLFVGLPWQVWFNFGFVGARYADYTYSYLAESHWKAFIEGARTEDPFSLDEILRWGKGVVRSVSPFRFDPPDVEIVALVGKDHDDYGREKETAFAEETSPTAILRRLGAFAQARCPARSIPTRRGLFASRKHRITRTDLKVDEWLSSELVGLINLTNGIAEGFAS